MPTPMYKKVIVYYTKKTSDGYRAYCKEYPNLNGYGEDKYIAVNDLKLEIEMLTEKEWPDEKETCDKDKGI